MVLHHFIKNDWSIVDAIMALLARLLDSITVTYIIYNHRYRACDVTGQVYTGTRDVDDDAAVTSLRERRVIWWRRRLQPSTRRRRGWCRWCSRGCRTPGRLQTGSWRAGCSAYILPCRLHPPLSSTSQRIRWQRYLNKKNIVLFKLHYNKIWWEWWFVWLHHRVQNQLKSADHVAGSWFELILCEVLRSNNSPIRILILFLYYTYHVFFQIRKFYREKLKQKSMGRSVEIRTYLPQKMSQHKQTNIAKQR